MIMTFVYNSEVDLSTALRISGPFLGDEDWERVSEALNAGRVVLIKGLDVGKCVTTTLLSPTRPHRKAKPMEGLMFSVSVPFVVDPVWVLCMDCGPIRNG